MYCSLSQQCSQNFYVHSEKKKKNVVLAKTSCIVGIRNYEYTGTTTPGPRIFFCSCMVLSSFSMEVAVNK